MLPRDRCDHVPRPVRRQLRAQGHGSAGQVAPEPGCAPQHLVGLQVVAPAQLLQERATKVLLDFQASFLDRNLGQTRDRGHVEELEGVGGRRFVAQEQHSAKLIVTCGDRHLGHDAWWDGGGAVARSLTHVATQRRQVGDGSGCSRGAQSGHHDRDHPAGFAGSELGHAFEPVTAQHGIHHAQVHRSHPLHHGGPAVVRVGLHRHVQCASFSHAGRL